MSVRLRYSFAQDKHDSSCRTQLGVYDGDALDASEIANALVHDQVNLRDIAELRFYHRHELGFVTKPRDDRLPLADFLSDDGTLLVKFVGATPRSVIGPSVVVDPNIGFLLDTLNPIIRMRFNAAGASVTRVYRAHIRTVGLRFCCSIRTQAAFVFRMPFTPVFTQQPIPLGRGVDLCWGLCLTFATFQNHAGFVLLVGVPVGLSVGASLVRGGTLVPLVHPENSPDFLVERIKLRSIEEQKALRVGEPEP